MLNTAQYTISIVHYFSRQRLLQNAALVIRLSLLPASLPTPSQLYGAGGNLCKVSRSRGASYPPQALPPSLAGRVHLPGERAEGHRHLQMSRGTEKESKCHPLGKTHGSRSASPHQHSGWDWEFHWDRGIFYPSTQNENHICLNRSFGSHVPRMSTNFLSWEWTYSGTNWLHGIHFFCVESKWKSYKVGRWPVIKSGQFCFDCGHRNTESALAHPWNELMLFVPWIET